MQVIGGSWERSATVSCQNSMKSILSTDKHHQQYKSWNTMQHFLVLMQLNCARHCIHIFSGGKKHNFHLQFYRENARSAKSKTKFIFLFLVLYTHPALLLCHLSAVRFEQNQKDIKPLSLLNILLAVDLQTMSLFSRCCPCLHINFHRISIEFL